MTNRDTNQLTKDTVSEFVDRLTDDRVLSRALGFRPDRNTVVSVTLAAEEIRPGLETLIRAYFASLDPIIKDVERRTLLTGQLTILVWDSDLETVSDLEALVAGLTEEEIIHVHQQLIRKGEPAIIVRTYKGSEHFSKVEILS